VVVLTERTLERSLISVNLMKPILSGVDEVSERYGLNRNRAIELLLAVGIVTFREWEKEFEVKAKC
jgi:metal-responsive CopG/Arc/MetJ family transcriptional regulator